MTTNNNNKTAVPEAKAALNQMKLEIANELGMSNYHQVDKGNLTARENGYVGGYMTKKLVEMAEQQMAGKSQQQFIRLTIQYISNKRRGKIKV